MVTLPNNAAFSSLIAGFTISLWTKVGSFKKQNQLLIRRQNAFEVVCCIEVILLIKFKSILMIQVRNGTGNTLLLVGSGGDLGNCFVCLFLYDQHFNSIL
jgi:hypothetical protein